MKAERILSVCAIMIAILSLFVSVYGSYQSRLHYRLSIKPALQVIFYADDVWEGFQLKSSGLGPGIIKWIEVLLDGKPQRSWEEVMEKLNIQLTEKYSINSIYPKDVYKPNEVTNLFVLKNNLKGRALRKYSKRIKINICYCSFYDECWLASNDIGENNSVGCAFSSGV